MTEKTPEQDLAAGLEADRLQTAEDVRADADQAAADVEARRVQTAQDVKDADLQTAEDVRAEQVETAAAVEQLRVDMAVLLEKDRKRHNTYQEMRLQAWTDQQETWLRAWSKKVNRRFLVLFLAMFAIFGLLAYRTEVNARNSENGFYEACLTRQDRQVTFNDSREEFIQVVMSGPNIPTDPATRQTTLEQLRAALLLPVEDCGPDPR